MSLRLNAVVYMPHLVATMLTDPSITPSSKSSHGPSTFPSFLPSFIGFVDGCRDGILEGLLARLKDKWRANRLVYCLEY